MFICRIAPALALAFVVLFPTAGAFTFGDEGPPVNGDKSVLDTETVKKPSRKVPRDVARLVEGKSPGEMLTLLREAYAKEPDVEILDDVAEFKKKKADFVLGLSDAILLAGVDKATASEAYAMRLKGLALRMQLNPNDIKGITALKKELAAAGGFPEVDADCDAYLYISKLRKTLLSKRVSRKDFDKAAEELKPLLRDRPESPYLAAAGLLLAAAEASELDARTPFAEDLRNDFIAFFRKSENEKLQELARQIEVDAMQNLVPGKRIRFKALTVTGEPFDLQNLRGKVVLLDFWATWCGPCRAEIPNMKAAYTQYRDKGFEIVGISVDRSIPDLQEFIAKERLPWIALSEVRTREGGLPGPAELFGVRGYPTMLLIDKNGRLISTGARGQELNRLLAEAFR